MPAEQLTLPAEWAASAPPFAGVSARKLIPSLPDALAQEVASRNVTVNTISPGYVDTDMVRAVKPELLDMIVSSIPLRRLGTPEEIASIVAWLASDESALATGADFSLNGGLHMC